MVHDDSDWWDDPAWSLACRIHTVAGFSSPCGLLHVERSLDDCQSNQSPCIQQRLIKHLKREKRNLQGMTKAKPLGRPLSRSLAMYMSSISPCVPNRSIRSVSVASNDRLPTNNFIGFIGSDPNPYRSFGYTWKGYLEGERPWEICLQVIWVERILGSRPREKLS